MTRDVSESGGKEVVFSFSEGSAGAGGTDSDSSRSERLPEETEKDSESETWRSGRRPGPRAQADSESGKPEDTAVV